MKTQTKGGAASTDGKATPKNEAEIIVKQLPVTTEKLGASIDLSSKIAKISEISQLTRWHAKMTEELAVLRGELNNTGTEKVKIAIGTGDYRSNWHTDHQKLVKEVVGVVVQKYEEKIIEIENEIIAASF